MKTIAILGSTGSIGAQALDIIRNHRDKYRVIALAAGHNLGMLAEQVGEFKPETVSIADETAIDDLKDQCKEKMDVIHGLKGIEEVSALGADIVINALVGSIGLLPSLKALETGSILALANKETMVAGGEIIKKLSAEVKSLIRPVDSEHSAIWQCLEGEPRQRVRRLLLTGSGGPFRRSTKEEMCRVTVEDALKHPRWVMGPKITIDSATMMNKGLEVIEAHYLFGVDYDEIEVVIHPESIIHSMVEFCDGSIKAHLGYTDMRIPIQYALSYPDRFDSPLVGLDLTEIGVLTFADPDFDRFPCLRLAYECGRKSGTYPAVLNAVNEETVAAFLAKTISLTAISKINQQIVEMHDPVAVTDYEDIGRAEDWARREARKLIAGEYMSGRA